MLEIGQNLRDVERRQDLLVVELAEARQLLRVPVSADLDHPSVRSELLVDPAAEPPRDPLRGRDGVRVTTGDGIVRSEDHEASTLSTREELWTIRESIMGPNGRPLRARIPSAARARDSARSESPAPLSAMIRRRAA